MAFRQPIRSLARLKDVSGVADAADGEALAKDDVTGKFTPRPGAELSGAVANAGGVTKVQAGTLAARPASADFGSGLYVTTDAPVQLFRSDGAAWTQVDAGGGAEAAVGVQTRRDTSQSIPHDTQTVVDWTGALTPDPNAFWASGQPGRLTVPAGLGGTYLIYASLYWTPNSTGQRSMRLRLSGGGLYSIVTHEAPRLSMTLIGAINLGQGAYLELLAYQSSGAALNLDGTYERLYLGMWRVGT